MTVQEVASAFAVSVQHLYNHSYRNDLPVYPFGSAIKIDLQAILRPTRRRGGLR